MAMDMQVALKINAGVTGQQAVDQLRTSMDKLNGAASSVGRGFEMATTAVGAFIGLQAVQGVALFARETINAADQLDEMSERTGIAVETLSELRFAAQMNGKALEDVQSALQRVSVKATDAATGNKSAALAFDALGISVKNADGSMRTALSITEDIGDAFRGIEDPTLKAALAVEIFGKQGPSLVPMIEKLEDARKEARELGVTVGSDFAAAAATFNDNMDRMAGMASALSRSLLNELLPSVNRIMEAMIQGQKGGEGAIWSGLRQATRNAVYDYGNLDKSITEVTEKIGRLVEMQNALSKDSLGAKINRLFSPGDLAVVNNQLAEARAVLAQMKALRGDKEAGAGRGFVNPPLVKPDQPDAKKILADLAKANAATTAQTEAEKEAARQEAERKQILAGLNDEVMKLVEGEEALTIAKLRRLGASEQEIAQAQALMTQRAQELAGIRELDRYTKEQQEAEQQSKRRQAQLDQEAVRNKEQLAEAGRRVFEETRTPAEKLNAEMVRLNDLLQAGAIDWATYYRAISQAQDEFDDLGKKGTDTIDDLKASIEGWGRQATDTFVDFAFTGKSSFKDMVNSILQDIARMVIQKTIMAPLMASVGGMFGFANGGIMTNSGPVPLNAYANGGIANSPQVALFGEGRMPEAYVPLPDGRTIPVTMTGSGGATNVVVNVNVESGQTQVEGNQGQELGRLIAGVVKAEIINQKRPGGMLAA